MTKDKEPELDYPNPPQHDGIIDESINKLLNEDAKKVCKGCRFRIWYDLYEEVLEQITIQMRRITATESGQYYKKRIEQLREEESKI